MVAPLLALAALGATPRLRVGMPAPSLAAVRWIAGRAPTRGVRVVEFWATWCAPCRDNIPHLTAIARKHAGRVEVVGIDVWEGGHTPPKGFDPKPSAESFVRRQGRAMAYTVGVDRPDGTIAKAWLDAAGVRGIPATFVLDARGRIAWIGNAYALDAALEAVLAHTDPARAVAAVQARQRADEARLVEAARRGDLAAVLAIRKRLPDSVSMESAYRLLRASRPEAARALAGAVLRDPRAGMWQFLELTWAVTDARSLSPEDARLAVALAQEGERRADPSDESHFACLDYVARAYAKGGDFENAAQIQARVVAILERLPKAAHADDLKFARRRLDAFRAGHMEDERTDVSAQRGG